MMKFQYSLILVISSFYIAYAIHCNECSTTNPRQTDCGDSYRAGNFYDVYCNKYSNTENAKGCLKVEYESQGVIHINRSCYWGDIKNPKGFWKQNSNQRLFVCTTDLCNSSTPNGAVGALTLLFVTLLNSIIS